MTVPLITNQVKSKFGCHLIPILAETGSARTITVKDLGKCITNRGGGALTVTLPLPATMPVGSWIRLFQVAAGDLVVTCAASLVVENNAAATTLTLGTNSEEIGNGLLIINIGAAWFVQMCLANTAATHTVA